MQAPHLINTACLLCAHACKLNGMLLANTPEQAPFFRGQQPQDPLAGAL